MSTQHDLPDLNELAAVAGETALYLIEDALECMQAIVARNDLEKLPASHAILAAAIAITTQRERHYEERLVSQTIGGTDGVTEDQRQRDYDRLKWLADQAMPNMNEAEYRETITRIVRLTGV